MNANSQNDARNIGKPESGQPPVSSLSAGTIDPARDFTCSMFAPLNLPPESFRDGLAVCVPEKLSDAVMCAPALRMLKSALPPCCGLFVVCRKKLLPLFGAMSCVDAVVPVADVSKCWGADARARLRSLHAGIGLILRPELHAVREMRSCGLKRLYGMRCRGGFLFLRRSFTLPENRHLADFFGSIARAFGAVGPFPVGSDIPELVWTDLADSDLSAIIRHPKVLLIASGAPRNAAKRWAVERYREAAAHWIAHGGIAVLVSPDTEPEIEALTHDLPPRRVFLLPPEIDLLKLMHIARFARGILSGDNGIGHLGALLGTGGVALFGPTDPRRRGPVSEKWRILSPQPDCSPCRGGVCRKASRCMDRITAADVNRELDRFL